MSSTPEINKNVKLFSPYGKPISKSHLTPCRQIGLSRKRKTLSGVSKTPLTCSTSATQDTTPLSAIPLNDSISVSGTKISDITRGKQNSKNNKTAKKRLDQNFDDTLCPKYGNNSEVRSLEGEKCKNSSKIAKLYLTESVSNTESTIQANKRSKRGVEEKISNNECLKDFKSALCQNESKCNEENENKVSKNRSKKKITNLNTVKICIKKLSADDIKSYEKSEMNCDKSEENDSSSEEFEGTIKRKKCRVTIISDNESVNSSVKDEIETENIQTSQDKISSNDLENDNKNCKDNILKMAVCSSDEEFEKIDKKQKKNILKRTESSDKRINTHTTLKSTKSSEILSKTSQQTEINEKIDLIEKIKKLENQVREKKKFLEDLKQAQVYKNIHNVDELEKLTEIWRTGCIKGLNELLLKLQVLGPVTMQMLLNNLNISTDIAEQCLKMEFKDEQNQDLSCEEIK